MKRTSRTVSAAAATLALGAVGLLWLACTVNETAKPPPPDNCVPQADASVCRPPLTGGGGGMGGPPGRDAAIDTGVITPDASNFCGQTARILITTNVSCVPCIVGTFDTGPNCCAEDIACANDTNCFGLIMCVNMCVGNSACIGACETVTFPQDTNFTAFAACVQATCPQCPPLNGGTSRDF